MPNDWPNKTLNDIVSEFTADVETDRAADIRKQQESERLAQEQKVTADKRRAAEDREIHKFINLVTPVFERIRDQLLAAQLDAKVTTWPIDKPSESPVMKRPGSKSRDLETLIQLTFANHPKDRVGESYMLFCAGRYDLWPPGKESQSPENARDAYVLFTGSGKWNDSDLGGRNRVKEGLFSPSDNGNAPTDELVDWIVKEEFAKLHEESKRRRGA